MILTEDKPISDEYSFRGGCYLCIEGSGVARIERYIGGSWRVLTTRTGIPMEFAGDGGVIFNSRIDCSADLKHRVVVETTAHITVDAVKGK